MIMTIALLMMMTVLSPMRNFDSLVAYFSSPSSGQKGSFPSILRHFHSRFGSGRNESTQEFTQEFTSQGKEKVKTMASTQAFCLRRSNQPSDLVRDFSQMLVDEDLTDVTLSCEDGCIQAHRIFLAANSPYFKSIFAKLSNSAIKQYPVIVLKDVLMSDMKAIMEFIYRGEATVPQDQLPSILKAADGLKIRGLEGVENVPATDGILVGCKKKRKRRKKSRSGSQGSEDGSDVGANGDSGNEGLSSEEDDYDHGTQIMAVSDGASTAEDIEPSKLLEQSMTVNDGSSETGSSGNYRFPTNPSSRCASNNSNNGT